MARNNKSAREPSGRADLPRDQGSRDVWEGFWRNVASIGPAALKYGCIAWGCAKAAEVLVAWTGAETKADVKLNVVTDVMSDPHASLLLPWALVAAVWLLYRRERKLKEKILGRLGEVSRKYPLASGPHPRSGNIP